jgi:hypothetical protein
MKEIMNDYRLRITLYLVVIAAAPTLDAPWMIAMQAAIGGLMIGIRLEQWRQRRSRFVSI